MTVLPHINLTVVKYADNTTIIGRITNNDGSCCCSWLMFSHRKMKQKNGTRAGQTTWNHRLLCPHLYTDLSPPQHPWIKLLHLISRTVFWADRVQDYSRTRTAGIMVVLKHRQNWWTWWTFETLNPTMMFSALCCWCLHLPRWKFKKCNIWFCMHANNCFYAVCVIYLFSIKDYKFSRSFCNPVLCDKLMTVNLEFTVASSAEQQKAFWFVSGIKRLQLTLKHFGVEWQTNEPCTAYHLFMHAI